MKKNYTIPIVRIVVDNVEPFLEDATLSITHSEEGESGGAKSSTTNFSIWDDEDNEEE